MWSASPEISRDTTGSLAERCGFPVGRGVYSRDMGRGNSREGGGAVSLSASAVDRDSNGSNGRALTSPRAPQTLIELDASGQLGPPRAWVLPPPPPLPY